MDRSQRGGRFVTICLAVLAALGASDATDADQCRPLEAKACTIWLHGESAPRASKACADEAWSRHLTFEQPKRFSDSNADGWAETVLAFRFPTAGGCRCVTFRIHYSGEAKGYSAHIGNSATNDGFGGDAGTAPTLDYAEAHTLARQLLLYSGGAAGAPTRDPGDPFAHHDRDLQLELPAMKGEALEIEVCDQSFAFAIPGPEEPRLQGRLETPLHEHSFVIDERSTIYAAFNRVIHEKNGAPADDRTGSGVGRVEFFLSP